MVERTKGEVDSIAKGQCRQRHGTELWPFSHEEQKGQDDPKSVAGEGKQPR